jgi:hypothetical protein
MYNISGIDQNPKLGYYRVADETYYSKPMAYMRAKELGTIPTWCFNNIQFVKEDWTVEPEVDLLELYRLRAQQIRDQYDYIRLDLSGGSDSATVLYSFVLNNIPLDEVVFRYPKQGEKGVVGDVHNYDPSNTLSEWEFSAKPMLHWISTNYPDVKITFYDYSQRMIDGDYLKDESWILQTRDWFQPGHVAKHDIFGAKEHREQADSGKKICILHGVDKPKVVVINGQWYTYFIDVFANQPSPIKHDYENITHELFFWTPDLPKLLIKQSHMIKTWFDLPTHKTFKYLVSYPVRDPNARTTYENIVKSIVYPQFDLTTWQTSKATNSFYNEMDHWFYTNFSDTEMYQVWKSGLEFLTINVDHDQFMSKDGKINGFTWNKSIFYHLGPVLDEVETEIIVTNHDFRKEHLKPEEITVWQNQKLKHITV